MPICHFELKWNHKIDANEAYELKEQRGSFTRGKLENFQQEMSLVCAQLRADATIEEL